MIRNLIERKAYEKLLARHPVVFQIVANKIGYYKESPLQIANELGQKNVIFGSLVLLAANYIKKSGIRPEKG